MGTKLVNYLLMYFLYSGLGWTVESTYRSLGETYRAQDHQREKDHQLRLSERAHLPHLRRGSDDI